MTLLKLEKENAHERDKRIIFDEESHTYTVDGKVYNGSVTGFIHKFFKDFDPEETINKYYKKWQDNTKHKYHGMTKDQIIKQWQTKAKLSSELGTKLHRQIELTYNSIPCDEPGEDFMLFAQYYKAHKHLKAYRTEWSVFHEELELAGQIDMLYKDDKGNFILCDWKRTEEIKLHAFSTNVQPPQMAQPPIQHLEDCNFIHYSIQLNIYKAILKEKYNIEVTDMFLVKLHPDEPTYKKYHALDLSFEVEQMFNMRYAGLR
jgi:ATP-dependent exoDNAse (exonuclease V) beta subunit